MKHFQLNDFLPTGATAFPSARFGMGTGPVGFSNIACTGTESNIVDCVNDGYGVIGSCTHADDASASCLEGEESEQYRVRSIDHRMKIL